MNASRFFTLVAGLLLALNAFALDHPDARNGSSYQPLVNYDKSLRYNQYTWLTAHNAYAAYGEGFHSGSSQAGSLIQQLNLGTRGFMLDIYHVDGKILLCHAQCGSDGFSVSSDMDKRLFHNSLQRFNEWLKIYPDQVLTLILEDKMSAGLSDADKRRERFEKEIDQSGIAHRVFDLDAYMKQNPKNKWPTLEELEGKVIILTSDKENAKSRYASYNWGEIAVENNYSLTDTVGLCEKRSESDPLKDKGDRLFIYNFFKSFVFSADIAFRVNVDILKQWDSNCAGLAENNSDPKKYIIPNFVAVDYVNKGYPMLAVNYFNAFHRAERPPESAISLKNFPAACVDVVNGSGANVRMYPCNGTDAQKWFYDLDTKAFLSKASNFTACLDRAGGGMANGTAIINYPCNRTPAQQWEYRGNSIYSVANDYYVVDGRPVDGKVHLYYWNGGGNQRWDFPYFAAPVALFDDAGFQGKVRYYGAGKFDYPWLGSAGNDRISSVKVKSGWRLTLYEHAGFGGRSRVVTGEVDFLGDFNDLTSSFKIEKLN